MFGFSGLGDEVQEVEILKIARAVYSCHHACDDLVL